MSRAGAKGEGVQPEGHPDQIILVRAALRAVQHTVGGICTADGDGHLPQVGRSFHQTLQRQNGLGVMGRVFPVRLGPAGDLIVAAPQERSGIFHVGPDIVSAQRLLPLGRLIPR